MLHVARAAGSALAAWLAVTAGAAAEPSDLVKLFPSECEVELSQEGLARLDLPAAVLAASKPDLSDLRLFEAQSGKEVPFLVTSLGAGALEVGERAEGRITGVRRDELRRETGPPRLREVYDLDVPATVLAGGSRLTVDVRRPEFVARVTVATLDADGVEHPEIEDGSVFRLSGAHHAERTWLELPPSPSAPAAGRLRVSLEHEEPAYLEPAFHFERGRSLAGTGRLTLALEAQAGPAAAGKTVLDLARPRGLVPSLLRASAETPTFDRAIVVRDLGQGAAGEVLATGRLWRVQAVAAVEALELSLSASRGERLRVEIDDGDSPPLAGLSFTAVVPQPVLVFSSEAPPADGPELLLRFGGGRAHRPRYDLAAFAPPGAGRIEGQRAEALAALYDLARLAVASAGPVRPNPAYDVAPALAFAMRPGARIETGAFAKRRALRVAPSPEGLARLRLSAEDLAVLRPDLGDARIADAAGRQWPYLLAPAAASVVVELAVRGPEPVERGSRYVLTSPVAPLCAAALTLEVDSPYFDRPFTLRATGENGSDLRGRLARPIGSGEPLGLDLSPLPGFAALELRVEDGDDAPLALRAARASVPVPDLFLAAPAGEYALLLGAPAEAAPRYDLERVRDVVLAVGAAAVEPGRLEPNPDYSLTSRLRGRAGLETALLWIALGGAVLTLLVLTLRLARKG